MPTLAHQPALHAAMDEAALAGRIGPNAVTRLAEALEESVGELRTNEIFRAAGHLPFRHAPPVTLVDETAVTALHASLRRALAPADASRVARRAGELTGDYLLVHRIPAPARALLRRLPAPWAAGLLVRAMEQHAWTFAGSGEFSASFTAASHAMKPAPGGARASKPRLQLSVAGCPLCRGGSAPEPVCDYFAATFERLFRALVSASTSVHETDCRATGAPACRFDVTW